MTTIGSAVTSMASSGWEFALGDQVEVISETGVVGRVRDRSKFMYPHGIYLIKQEKGAERWCHAAEMRPHKCAGSRTQ